MRVQPINVSRQLTFSKDNASLHFKNLWVEAEHLVMSPGLQHIAIFNKRRENNASPVYPNPKRFFQVKNEFTAIPQRDKKMAGLILH